MILEFQNLTSGASLHYVLEGCGTNLQPQSQQIVRNLSEENQKLTMDTKEETVEHITVQRFTVARPA